jgi:hypothetical protein
MSTQTENDKTERLNAALDVRLIRDNGRFHLVVPFTKSSRRETDGIVRKDGLIVRETYYFSDNSGDGVLRVKLPIKELAETAKSDSVKLQLVIDVLDLILNSE